MSQYGVIYRLQWNTVPSVMSDTLTIPAQAIIVNIYDTETLIDDADTPLVIPLQAAANPLIIKIISNDEDKFSPIRAKQAVIQFISDSPAFEDVTTFSDSSDNRWYVEIVADGVTIFLGFLMLPDSQMDFLPDPNVVQLTASDHLALLKDTPLTTDLGENPVGKFRIAELIALCLKKTGLSLDLIVINNLRHGSGSITQTASFIISPNEVITSVTNWFYVGQRVTVSGTASNNVTFTVLAVGQSIVTIVIVDTPLTTEANVLATFTDTTSSFHFYDGIYLDAKTFEQEIGLSEFCYTVIEKILGEDCFLTQWLGKWYIMRVDEYDGNPIYPAEFDADGAFVAFNTPTDFSKPIGEAEPRRFANADALLRFDRPNNFIKETYKYLFPEELICNIDFGAGEYIEDLPDETIGDDTYQVKKYSLDCWTIARYQADGTNTLASAEDVYVKRFYQFGYEKTRYVVITAQSEANPFAYLRSEGIPVGNGDRGKISVDFRENPITSNNFSGVLNLILFGVSGSVYACTLLGVWLDATTYGTSYFMLSYTYTDPGQKTEFTNFSLEFPSTPEAGTMYVYLAGGYVSAGGHNLEFKNLQLEYRPLVNGSYLVYTGNFDKVQRTATGFFAKREKEVYIQDALRPLFKGALFFRSGDKLLYSGSVSFTAPTGINISGFHVPLFAPGQKIVVSGTALNDGTYTVVSVSYIIIGPFTQVVVAEPTLVNETVSCDISEFTYQLTRLWYTAAPFYTAPPPASDGTPPDTTYLHPYGYIQAYSVWNQYRNANRIFSTSVLGLGSMWCDGLDKILLTDTNPNTNNRYFMLISFEQNWKTALWSGVFIEDYSTVIPKNYDDPHEFKYLTK